MAPPTWTTPEQSEWLVSMKPAFHEARVKGRQKTWHASLCLSWFVKWPEIKVLFGDVLDKDLTPEQRETLAAAELKRKAQLTRWYQNHASESRTARAAAAPLPREVTGLTKTRRAPHAREVYIRMYYDEARRDRVRAALEAARNGSTQPLSRAQTFSITRKTLEEIYEAEPAEVKDAVARRIDTERRLLAIPAANANEAPNRTPEDYQRAINAAPGWLERIVSPIADVCGWCFTVVGAGPSPQEGGEIASFACHFGTTPTGHTFEQASPNFKDQYIRPMVHFAKAVYSRDERANRALSLVQPDSDSMATSEQSEYAAAKTAPLALQPSPSRLMGTRTSTLSAVRLPSSQTSPAPPAPSAEAVLVDPLWQVQADTVPSSAALLAATSLIDFAGVGHAFPLRPNQADDDDSLLGLLEYDDGGSAYNGFDMPFDFERGVFVPSNTSADITTLDTMRTLGPGPSGATGATSLVNSSRLVPAPSSETSGDAPSRHPQPTSGSTTPPSLPTSDSDMTVDRLGGTLAAEDAPMETERPQRARKLPGRYSEAAERPSKRTKANNGTANANDDMAPARATRTATTAVETDAGAGVEGRAKAGSARGRAKAGSTRGGAKAGSTRGKAKAGLRATRGGEATGPASGDANGSARGKASGATRGKSARRGGAR